MELTKGDIECSVVLDVIENLSRSETEERGSWVNLDIKSVEEAAFGVVPRQNVLKKVMKLIKMGLIESRQEHGKPTLFRLSPKSDKAYLSNKCG